MKRTLPGFLLAAVWLLLLIKGSATMFYLAMIGIGAIGALEYLRMALPADEGRFARMFLVVPLLIPVVLTGLAAPGSLTLASLFLSFFLLVCYVIVRYAHLANSYDQFCRLVFGVVYVGLLTSYLVVLRYLPEGGSWLVVLSCITAGSDSGAYYFGSNFGRRKLCPHISPKKTVEGALGGLLCSCVVAFVAALLLFDSVNWVVLFGSVLVLTGVGILGDLTESIIKRGTHTKDSGTLLAGHGGILDRLDSMLLASPLLYYLLVFTGRG